jgi:hypothetical protein
MDYCNKKILQSYILTKTNTLSTNSHHLIKNFKHSITKQLLIKNKNK